jgi:3-hydroxyisobutyrate dehydrogenase
MAGTENRDSKVPTAVLGTGIMGSAMARNLIAAGLPTTVWDRSTAATAPLSEAGRWWQPRRKTRSRTRWP